MGTIIDIHTPYRELEQDALKDYFDGIENPPSHNELKEKYPDVAKATNDIYDNEVWIYGTTREPVPREEIEYEKYSILLEHHNRMLLAWLQSLYVLSPLYFATSKIKQIVAQYPTVKSSLSKSEYLQGQYRIYRDFINEKLYKGDRSLLAIDIDYGRQEISDTFNLDNLSLFQELMTAYFISFFCDYFRADNKIEEKERTAHCLNAFQEYMGQSNDVPSSFNPDLFDILNDWLSVSQDFVFEFESFSGKDIILEMLEDLNITNNGIYCGGVRSKSQILGFVEACKEFGLLPEVSKDVLCGQIALSIKMEYKARLKSGDISEKMYKKTRIHIKSNKSS